MVLSGLLNIERLNVSADGVVLSLPVSSALMQPFGVVHGGINAVLAEEAASLGAMQYLDDGHVAVGVDLEVHHLRPVTSGVLIAVATPEHVGGTMQTWSVGICNTPAEASVHSVSEARELARDSGGYTGTATVILLVRGKPESASSSHS